MIFAQTNTPDSLKSGVPNYINGPDSSTIEHSVKQEEVFTYAEVMPEFNGEGGFSKYLSTHTKFPKEEQYAQKQGTVYVRFIVEKDGSITNVRMIKEVADAPGFSKEAIRVISEMPPWKPGLMNGRPVRIEMMQPIRFVLPGQ